MSLFFPTTIVDDIFPNPDSVRDFALQLDYSQADDGSWPGMRTDNLAIIAPTLHSQVVSTILSLFFDLDLDSFSVDARSHFQLIGGTGKGYVHMDNPIATSIIYLSPFLSNDCGTSLYDLNAPFVSDLAETRREVFHNNITTEQSEEFRQEHNNQFIETLSIKNKYNRMIMFDGHLFHAGHGPVEQTSNEEKRLTLVTFFYKIGTDKRFPIQKAKKTIHKF